MRRASEPVGAVLRGRVAVHHVVALRRRGDDESGSAILEFLLIGVVIIAPLFYLVVSLARVQAGTYAVSQAAREAARTYVTAPNSGAAAARARASASMAFSDQGFRGGGNAALTCAPRCLEPGGTVTANTSLHVDLPLVPGFLKSVLPTSVTLTATHTQRVPRYAERP